MNVPISYPDHRYEVPITICEQCRYGRKKRTKKYRHELCRQINDYLELQKNIQQEANNHGA